MKRAAKALRTALQRHDVKAVFHLPGSAVVPLYAGLDGVELVLMKHPEAAGFAADAYARLRGVGAALVAQGPGLAGVIPAVIQAWKDHVPVVVITARPGYMEGDPGAWQAFPARDVLGSVVKGFVEVAGDLPEEVVSSAFELARTPPGGPVVINFLEGAASGGSTPQGPAILPPVEEGFVIRILGALEDSSRPLVLAGAGLLEEHQHFRAFAHRLGAPVVTTAPARGILDEGDPLCLGPVGTIGFDDANRALEKADLILALGCRLSRNAVQPLLDSGSRPTVIQIAGSPTDRSPLADHFTVSSARSVMEALYEKIEAGPWFEPPTRTKGRISPALAAALGAVGAEDVLVMDAGTVGLSTYKAFLARKPNHLLYQWGLATMGTSLASAVGACYAGTRRAVVVSGDGGFLAGISELATISERSLPVKVVIFNNRGLQFIREIQKRGQGGPLDASFGPLNLASVAEAFGLRASRMDEGEEPSEDILAALRDPEPLVLEVEYGKGAVDLDKTQWDRGQSRVKRYRKK